LATAKFQTNAKKDLVRVIFFDQVLATFEKRGDEKWKLSLLTLAIPGVPLISDLNTPDVVEPTPELEALEMEAVSTIRELIPELENIFR